MLYLVGITCECGACIGIGARIACRIRHRWTTDTRRGCRIKRRSSRTKFALVFDGFGQFLKLACFTTLTTCGRAVRILPSRASQTGTTIVQSIFSSCTTSNWCITGAARTIHTSAWINGRILFSPGNIESTFESKRICFVKHYSSSKNVRKQQMFIGLIKRVHVLCCIRELISIVRTSHLDKSELNLSASLNTIILSSSNNNKMKK